MAEGVAFEDGFDLGCGAGGAGHVDVEFVGQQLLDGGCHGGGGPGRGAGLMRSLGGGGVGGDDDVAALEDGDGVGVAGLGQLGAQFGHRHPVVTAHVDAAGEARRSEWSWLAAQPWEHGRAEAGACYTPFLRWLP